MSLTRDLVRLVRTKRADRQKRPLSYSTRWPRALGALKTEPAWILKAIAPLAAADTARGASQQQTS